MEIDIQRYIEGEMTNAERTAFERQMEANPALKSQVDEQAFLIERLQSQMLREKISTIVAEGGGGNPPQQKTYGRLVWLLIPLLLVLAAVVWHFNKGETKVVEAPPTTEWPTEPVAPQLEEEKTPIQNEPPVEAPAEKTETKTPPKRKAIADNSVQDVLPPSNSGVRGESTIDENWEQKIASVWQTKFNPKTGDFNERFTPVADLLKEKNTTDAFVQLYMLERQSPENDTLAYLKGYCLLEMREGAQALSYFNKIKNRNSWSENIDWYRSLALVINSEKEKAVQEAESIIENKNHLFYKEAKKLMEVIR